ncbi:hypothetical protein BB560_004546 [Smittium megazygosporum]|uniref:Uncharacterized protein n=1 Tax=Smittium megazygosporum TaxID=133381 RepID=A0A2T9Z925_9FUNG|nr:hypothetical protein BB560_004546 [Smittium megazygosporum]
MARGHHHHHKRGEKEPIPQGLPSHIEAHPYEELAFGFDTIPDVSDYSYAMKHSAKSGTEAHRHSQSNKNQKSRKLLIH